MESISRNHLCSRLIGKVEHKRCNCDAVMASSHFLYDLMTIHLKLEL